MVSAGSPCDLEALLTVCSYVVYGRKPFESETKASLTS